MRGAGTMETTYRQGKQQNRLELPASNGQRRALGFADDVAPPRLEISGNRHGGINAGTQGRAEIVEPRGLHVSGCIGDSLNGQARLTSSPTRVAALERSVPVEAELLAVERELGLERDTLLPTDSFCLVVSQWMGVTSGDVGMVRSLLSLRAARRSLDHAGAAEADRPDLFDVEIAERRCCPDSVGGVRLDALIEK